MGKTFSLFASFYIALFSLQAMASDGACSGQSPSTSEQQQAGALEQTAQSCSSSIPPTATPEQHQALNTVSTEASSIQGQFGNYCNNSKTGYEQEKTAKDKIAEAQSKMRGSSDFSAALEAAKTAKAAAVAAKTEFGQAENAINSVDNSMQTISSNINSARVICPNLDESALAQSVRNHKNQIERDKQSADALSDQADQLANAALARMDTPQNPSGVAGSPTNPAGAPPGTTPPPPAPTPAANSGDNDSDLADALGNMGQGGQPGGENGGNEPNNNPPPPPPAAQTAQTPAGNEKTEQPDYKKDLEEDKTLDQLFAEKEKKEKDAAYDGEPSSKVGLDKDGEPVRKEERVLGASKLADASNNSDTSKRGLGGIDTESAKYTQNNAANSPTNLSAPGGGNSTSFLQKNVPTAVGRALASPEGKTANFENLTVDEALKKINQIPISK